MIKSTSIDGMNGNETAKFKFFKKRRQHGHIRDASDFTSYNIQHSQNYSQEANSYAENSKNSRRKILDSQPLNSFKGLLNDLEEFDKVQSSTNDHNGDFSDIIDDDQNNLYPKRPNIDLRKCIPIYYILWIRDQLLYGNCNISILNNNERKVEEILNGYKVKIENLKSCPSANSANYIEILRLLYSKYMTLYKSYLNLVREHPPLNRFSGFAMTNGVYVRMVNMTEQGISSLWDYDDNIDLGHFSQIEGGNLTHDNIIANFFKDPYNSFGSQTGRNESGFYIGEHYIEGPTIINSSHLPSTKTIPMEYLPLKMGKEYLGDWCEGWYRKEAIAQSLWERATKELIIVKALVNIPFIPLAEFEGFDVSNISAGERFWIPLYIAERLCYLGLVYIEIPFWLLPDHLKEFHEKENNTQGNLSKLPSDYFFEIAHAFMTHSSFKRICFPPSKTRLSEQTIFSILSKASGIVEDIKECRENKIRAFVSTLKSQNFFTLLNLQFSETYLLSQFLGAFWPYKNKSITQTNGMKWKEHTKELNKQLKDIAIQNS